ncbi:hypothetical protein ACFTWS_39880 [Streptomyces sp. NPDC057027]|uniref:hypothetical protein n=1 Tax=Streptomyces sp. NPDC057027 TaxID=3346004 RepID=UPI00363FC070
MRQVAGGPVEREMHRARIGLTLSRQDEKDVQPDEDERQQPDDRADKRCATIGVPA